MPEAGSEPSTKSKPMTPPLNSVAAPMAMPMLMPSPTLPLADSGKSSSATGEYVAFISLLASKPPVASMTLLALMV